MAKTAIATNVIARGMVRSGSRASSARFETVSIPVYAIIATGIARAKLDQVGASPQWMLDAITCGWKIRKKPSSDEQQLCREVEHRQEDVDPRGFLDADDVQAHEQPCEEDPDDHVPRRVRSGSQKIER